MLLDLHPVVVADAAPEPGTPVFIPGLTTRAPLRRIHVELTVAWEVRQRFRNSATTAWTVDDPDELWLILDLPPE